jgi:hypothetical protein
MQGRAEIAALASTGSAAQAAPSAGSIQYPCERSQSDPSAIVDSAIVTDASSSDLRNPVFGDAVVLFCIFVAPCGGLWRHMAPVVSTLIEADLRRKKFSARCVQFLEPARGSGTQRPTENRRTVRRTDFPSASQPP